MNKEQIRIYAVSVVTSYGAKVNFYKDHDRGIYTIADVVDEWRKTDEAFNVLKLCTVYKFWPNTDCYIKKLIEHTVTELTKLADDGYTLDLVE